MSWWAYLTLFLLLIIVILYFRADSRREIPFIGLGPLTGPIGIAKQYFRGLGDYLLEEEEEETTALKLGTSKRTPKKIPKSTSNSLKSPVSSKSTPVPPKPPRSSKVRRPPTPYPAPSRPLAVFPSTWNLSQITGDKKRERISRHVLETVFRLPFPSIRPSWLRNPKTGRNLEIDCFNEELGLALECSGEQHFKQSSHFHHSREQFLSQIYRDRIKKELILERGHDFIVVPYTVLTLEIPEYLREMLGRLGRLA